MSRRRRKLLLSSFTPAIISDNVLWLDAADTRTITDSGGSVSQWDDKSGNGNNVTQGVGSAQPTTGATTQNGNNLLDFDGSDFLVGGSGLFSIPDGNNTAFVVGVRTSEDGSEDHLLAADDGAVDGYLFSYSATAGSINFRSRNAGGGVVTDTGNTNTNFQILRARRAGTTQAIAVNGGAETTNASGVDWNAVTRFTIGRSVLANTFLIGSIAEIIIYRRALSAAERAMVETYLSNKWNISITAPDNIGGLQLWLDAADAATITESSGSVSQWDDKSGNNNNVTQGTGSEQPTTGATSENGLNVIDFDGGDELDAPSALFTIANGANTQFVVSTTSINNTEQRLISLTEAGSMRSGMEYVIPTDELRYYNRTTYAGVTITGVTKSNFNIFTGSYDGAVTRSISLNGGTPSTDSNGQLENGVNGGNIGSGGGSRFLTGSIAEILIYDRLLSSDEISAVETYLSNKWGVTLA